MWLSRTGAGSAVFDKSVMLSARAVRNVDILIYISSDDERKTCRFIVCSIVYFEVLQNTLFTAIFFHHLDAVLHGVKDSNPYFSIYIIKREYQEAIPE